MSEPTEYFLRREPWYSVHERRFAFKRLLVQIPALSYAVTVAPQIH